VPQARFPAATIITVESAIPRKSIQRRELKRFYPDREEAIHSGFLLDVFNITEGRSKD
jgi:hypothetical protein